MESNAILWIQRSTDPSSNPGANELFLYALGNDLKIKRSSGAIETLSTGLTQEQVQDLIGSAFDSAGGQGITQTYDDVGNQLVTAIDAPTWNLIQNALQAADIADFETTAELDARDTANRNRANHTGTQAISTVTGLQTELDSKLEASDIASLVPEGRTINTTAPLQGGGDLSADRTLSLANSGVSAGSYTNADITVDALGRVTSAASGSSSTPIFGSEFEDFLDLSNVSYTTNTPFEAYSFTTLSKPAGRYRIYAQVSLQPGSSFSNDLITLRVDGTILDPTDGYVNEGKDTGGDIREKIPLLGYYVHGGGSFDIEIWANQDGGGTSVLHNVIAECWRVS
jgi:hypothetical protein